MPISQVVLDKFHILRSTHGAASVSLLRRDGPLVEVLLKEGPGYIAAVQVDRADAFPVPAIVGACVQATEQTPHYEALLVPYGVDAAWAARVKTNAAVLSQLADDRTVQVRHAAIDRALEGSLREEAAEALRPVLYTMRAGKMDRWLDGGLEDLGTIGAAYATLVNVHAAVTHPFVRERCLALSLPADKLDRVGEVKGKLYGYFTTVASLDAAPETGALQIRVARALLLDELRLLWSQVQWVLPPGEQEKFAMGRLLGRPSSGRARPEPEPTPVPVPPVVVGPPVVGPPVVGPPVAPPGPAPAFAPPGPAVQPGAVAPPAFAPASPPAAFALPALPVTAPGQAPPPAGTVLGTFAPPGQPPCAYVVQPDGSAAWVPATVASPPAAPPTRRRGKARSPAAPAPGRTRRR